jgi:hypothetical protein
LTGEEATIAVIDALNALGVPYMLVGSFSSNYYGIPRASQDADFLVHTEGEFPIHELLRQLGPDFRLDPQLGFELVQGSTRYLLRVAKNCFQIEIFLLSDEEYDRRRFARRRCVQLFGRSAYLPAVEDVVITKLRWSQHGRRLKDQQDVLQVLAVQKEIDWSYVHYWCRRHGTEDTLQNIRKRLAD